MPVSSFTTSAASIAPKSEAVGDITCGGLPSVSVVMPSKHLRQDVMPGTTVVDCP